jgi:TRAP-type C4-dicarboxylate transport system permease small subunit
MIAFVASGYGLSTGHHFRVALLSEKIPALAKPLATLSGVLEALFGLILLIAGAMQAYGALEQDLRSDTLLQVPQFWPMLAFPIGGLAILLQGLSHIIVPRVRGFRS